MVGIFDASMTVLSMSDIHMIVRAAWERTFTDSQIRDDSDFFLLGGDSIAAAMLLLTITEMTGVEIQLSELYANSSLVELTSLIERMIAPEQRPHDESG